MKENIYIVQGKANLLEGLVTEAREIINYEMCWTCPATVKVRDIMLIYLMKPISSVVCRAVFTSTPFIYDDSSSEWKGYRMANYENVQIFENFLSLKRLNELFPQWHWTKRPQGAIKVPDIYQVQLFDLLV